LRYDKLDDEKEGDFSLDVSLCQYQSLWGRIKSAARYVFGGPIKSYQHYCSVLISEDDAKDIAGFITGQLSKTKSDE
jgi:hypothetical protein